MQTPAVLDGETCESCMDFGDITSDDEYLGIGACSVFSESESDFDQDNCVGDCDVWEAGSEVVEEPSSFRNLEGSQQPKTSCLKRGVGIATANAVVCPSILIALRTALGCPSLRCGICRRKMNGLSPP